MCRQIMHICEYLKANTLVRRPVQIVTAAPIAPGVSGEARTYIACRGSGDWTVNKSTVLSAEASGVQWANKAIALGAIMLVRDWQIAIYARLEANLLMMDTVWISHPLDNKSIYSVFMYQSAQSELLHKYFYNFASSFRYSSCFNNLTFTMPMTSSDSIFEHRSSLCFSSPFCIAKKGCLCSRTMRACTSNLAR